MKATRTVERVQIRAARRLSKTARRRRVQVAVVRGGREKPRHPLRLRVHGGRIRSERLQQIRRVYNISTLARGGRKKIFRRWFEEFRITSTVVKGCAGSNILPLCLDDNAKVRIEFLPRSVLFRRAKKKKKKTSMIKVLVIVVMG